MGADLKEYPEVLERLVDGPLFRLPRVRGPHVSFLSGPWLVRLW